MKRQSAAEAALAKQVKAIENQITELNYEVERLGVRLRTLQDIRDDLTAEMETLRQARLTASESRK